MSVPPSTIPTTLLERLARIRADFMGSLEERLDRLDALAGDAPLDVTAMAAVVELAHTLAGAGGTFGLPELTVAARQVEEWFRRRPHPPHPRPLEEADRRELDRLLAGLRRAATLPALDTPPPSLGADGDGEPLHHIHLYRDPQDIHPGADGLCENLAAEIRQGGYAPRVFTDAHALAEACRDRPPGAVVIDAGAGDHATATLAALRASGRLPAQIPLVQAAGRTSFADRLAALRAGCGAFFPRPVDIGRLLDHLDLVTGRATPEPLRVLIVEDDRAVADYYAAILDSAGLRAEVLNDPLGTEQAIRTFNPDMLLINVAMPACSGFDLVGVLRQHETYSALPVVFVTADIKAETLRAAIRSGVDGFLTKPVALTDLVEVSRARAQRGRLFKGLVARDSLTGTYNHAMIHEMLATELARAQRERRPLSVVMVDIDQFKAVNDGHGHAAGDLVIKSLAHRLSRDLRRTDIIGRYGGEEFTILMPGTTAQEALERIDNLRRGFATTPFSHCLPARGTPPAQATPAVFTVTFSGGVAEYRPAPADHGPPGTRLDAGKDPGEGAPEAVQDLLRRADDALYAAKRDGRNRVHLAPD